MNLESKNFTHLHVHSHYSLLDGLAKIDDLITEAKNRGMNALALTDHGTMYGIIEFYKKAKKAGIKPIIGCEIYVAIDGMKEKRPGIDHKRYHLVLLAKNLQGYQNLLKIVTEAHLEGFYYKPRADKELLKKYSEGLIALSACLAGEIPRAIAVGNLEKAKKIALDYQKIFGTGNFYLEIGHHPNIKEQNEINEKIIAIGRELNIPIVATNDAHYLKSEDAVTQDILVAVQTNSRLDDEDRLTMKLDDFSLRSPEQMAEFFNYIPEAIENTQKISDNCNLEIKLGETQLPYFEVPGNYTINSFLEKLCNDGFEKRYGNLSDNEKKAARERLAFELSVIEKTGFASYFLIVQDFVNWAKQNRIVVGPGRGSAAGSIVSYLLNITNIDPIKYNLLFERFLNPERISMPDIDLDFADIRRDEVIEYVSQKYGRDKVAQIITFGTMAARAAIRDTGRAMGLPYGLCDQTAKLIPFGMNLKESLETVAEFKNFYDSNEQIKKLVDAAAKLEGVARHASTHACGVVITKNPLTDFIPLQYASSTGKKNIQSLVTQYEMHAIEDLGLLKMDFLGLKNLSIIERTLKQIEFNHDKKINIDDLPLDDEKTFELFRAAHTTGVFQLESSGMKRYLKELKPTELEDIIAMVALYRPGPLEFIPDFINRKHGRQKVVYLHPKLENILKNTYGIAVYQEQLMQIARDLAGFTLSEVDVLRKAVGKKIKSLLDEQKEKLINGMMRNGISNEIAKKIWDAIEPFASYGFNRSHAACYALLGYQTAYLKANYPAEYMASLLTADIGDIERTAFLINECKEMKLSVLPPQINNSFKKFYVDRQNKNNITFGLLAIKNVGENVIEEIINEREKNGKFKNLTEFLNRVESKDLNKKSLESLIKCGAFDEFGERKQMLEGINAILEFSKNSKKQKQSKQQTMFGEEMFDYSINLPPTEPAPLKEKLTWEKELLGLYVSDHPLNEYKEKMRDVFTIKKIIESISENNSIYSDASNRIYKVGGIINSIKKIITKTGKPMIFVNFEDLSGKIELIVFPKLLEKLPNCWKENNILIVDAKISGKDNEIKLICEKAVEIN